MYLKGLRSVDIMYDVSADQCKAFGGAWTPHSQNIYNGTSSGNCTILSQPAAPAPAKGPSVNVSVPTNVITQVSPAISPNLIQQQQPTNSPVGASTSASPAQSASPTQTSSPGASSGPDIQKYLDAIAAQTAQQAAASQAASDTQNALLKAQQDQLDAFLKAQTSSTAPAAQMPVPQQVVTQYVPDTSSSASPTPAPVAIAPAPTTNYLPFIIMGGALLFLLSQDKGKNRVHA